MDGLIAFAGKLTELALRLFILTILCTSIFSIVRFVISLVP